MRLIQVHPIRTEEVEPRQNTEHYFTREDQHLPGGCNTDYNVNKDARWVEHFKQTLNQHAPDSTVAFDTPDPANDLDMRTDAITSEETAVAMKLLKNGGAGPGHGVYRNA